ncbi:MAG: hypothetical protein FJ109_07135, partial [Deltaproteobacteria bacterium]|nr:hypothetical protein [Deltaproteobacteria bacterium]
MRPVLSALLLASACVGVVSCADDARVSLTSLAEKAPVPETTLVAGPTEAPPIVVLSANKPEKLVGRVRMLLPLLLPEGVPAWLETALASAPPAALYGEIVKVSVGLDPETATPRLEQLEGLFLITPAAGGGGQLDADRWQGLLGTVWPKVQGSHSPDHAGGALGAPADAAGSGVSCLLRSQGTLCVAGRSVLPEAAVVDGFLSRAAAASGTPGVRLSLSIPEVLRMLEQAVGVPLLWAVVPEQARTLGTLALSLSDEEDAIRLVLTGRHSELLGDVAGLFGGAARPVRLPADVPGVAFTSIDSVEDRAEKLQEHWLDKAQVLPELKLTSLLDDTWNSQMLGLASGVVGIAFAGDVNPESPFDEVVWLIQPTDRKMLDKRFAHIFATKYFKLNDLTLRTGETVYRALRKSAGQKLGKERLAWFYRDGTCYVAANSEILRKLADRMFVPDWKKDKPVLDLALSGEERALASVSLKRLLDRVVLSEELGFAGGMALGVLKNAVAALDKDVEVRLVVSAAPDGPAHIEISV